MFEPGFLIGSACTTAMRAGERCGFHISEIHGSSSGKGPRGTLTAQAANYDVGPNIVAEITRKAQGATLRNWNFLGVKPGRDVDADYEIGNCAAQRWEPTQFDLSEEEFKKFSTLQKTLSIRSPRGVNDCIGTGTFVLTGQR